MSAELLLVEEDRLLGRALLRLLRGSATVTWALDAKTALACVVGSARLDVVLCNAALGAGDLRRLLGICIVGQPRARRLVYALDGATTALLGPLCHAVLPMPLQHSTLVGALARQP